jgi:hypothetical protein
LVHNGGLNEDEVVLIRRRKTLRSMTDEIPGRVVGFILPLEGSEEEEEKTERQRGKKLCFLEWKRRKSYVRSDL